MKSDYSMISRSEEHSGQHSSRKRAMAACKRAEQNTGRKHHYILCTTYRDLCPRICWYVYLWACKASSMKRAIG